jgi:DNA-directed RNA polymerase II subunit RPB1
VGFLNEVYKIVQCVCLNCARILGDKNNSDFIHASRISNGKKRLHAMLRLCRSKSSCKGSSAPPSASGEATVDEDGNVVAVGAEYGCGALQPKYRRNGLTVEIEYPEGKDTDMGLADRKQVLTPRKVYEVFRRISDADAGLLGLDPRYARPEWLVLTVMPVPPPHVRPSVEQGTGMRADDDITHKLSEIIKANIAVANAQKSGQPQVTQDQYEANLQYHCATLLDNQLPGIPAATQRGGKVLKAFRERLVGKGGRVRGNLMGKRVDFSARTVITADPILSIHQVGVPRSIASNLTVPERVSRYSLPRLQTYVNNGPYIHPGAKFIIRENGVRIDLRFASNTAETMLK